MQSDDDDDSACMRNSRTDCFPTECLTHKWPGRARAFPKDLEAARPSAVIHSGGSFEVKDEVRAAKNGNPCTYPPLLCVRSCDRCGCSQPRRVQSISHTHPLTTFTPKMGFLPYHRSARTTNQHNMNMTKKLITMMATMHRLQSMKGAAHDAVYEVRARNRWQAVGSGEYLEGTGYYRRYVPKPVKRVKS